MILLVTNNGFEKFGIRYMQMHKNLIRILWYDTYVRNALYVHLELQIRITGLLSDHIILDQINFRIIIFRDRSDSIKGDLILLYFRL